MEGDDIISTRPAPAATTRAAWPRRRFVAQGLLALAAGPVLVRTAGGRAATENPPSVGNPDVATGQAQDTGSGAVRSASLTDNRLTTAVRINGSGPYRFLVDTGAERTLIAAEIAARLALPRGPEVLVQGIIRGQPEMLVKIASLRMGRLVCPDLEAPVLPRAMLGVDGYLGLDVLDRHRVVFDFAAHRLTVTRPQGFFAALWGRGDEAVVHTLGSSGRLRATDCLVGGVRAAAFIDTGAEVSVSNPALYAALQRRRPDQPLIGGPVQLLGVTGGAVSGLAVGIDRIRLGELLLTDTPLVVAPLQVFDLWGLRAQPALLFGMDCLRRFRRVSIDYGRKELRFEVASVGPAQPLQAGLQRPLAG